MTWIIAYLITGSGAILIGLGVVVAIVAILRSMEYR